MSRGMVSILQHNKRTSLSSLSFSIEMNKITLMPSARHLFHAVLECRLWAFLWSLLMKYHDVIDKLSYEKMACSFHNKAFRLYPSMCDF